MDDEKFKRLIAAIGLTIITGDVGVRIQYLGIMITHLEHWIQNEKIAKDRDAILSVRRNLMNAFNYIVSVSAHSNKTKEEKIQEIRDHFIRGPAIVLDQSWGSPRAVYGAQCLAELESLRLARQVYVGAVGSYSDACRGMSSGLTDATNACDNCIKLVLDVCYDNDLLDIGEKEFMKSAARPPEPEPARGKS